MWHFVGPWLFVRCDFIVFQAHTIDSRNVQALVLKGNK